MNRGYRQDRLENSQVVLGSDWPKKAGVISRKFLSLIGV
jgi:hypothetical protein